MTSPSLTLKLLSAITTPHGPIRLQALMQRGPLPGMGQVTRIQQRSANVVELSLSVGSDFQGFQAGQYLQLGQQIDGRWVKRPFSPACAPFAGAGELHFAIRIQDQGLWTGHLQQGLAIGQPIMVGQAAGDYVLPETAGHIDHLVLVSGGTGLAPNLSLAAFAAEQGIAKISLLHYNRNDQDIPGEPLLKQLQENPAVRWQPINTALKPSTSMPWAGHFHRRHIQALSAPNERQHIMVCGPESLRTAVHKLGAHKTDPRTVHSESFGLALRPTGTASKTSAVEFSRSQVKATASGQSLLEIAEANGLNPEFGCRMGICASCTCRKTQGQVRDLRDGSLSAHGEEEIRLCVSAPVGDVQINL